MMELFYFQKVYQKGKQCFYSCGHCFSFSVVPRSLFAFIVFVRLFVMFRLNIHPIEVEN